MANALKKTMVYLGLAEENLDGESVTEVHERPAKRSETPSPAEAAPARPNVTSLHRVTPTKPAVAATTMSEIATTHPRGYEDAPKIADSFREGTPVIMNLSRVNDADARRIIDFAGGLVMGLNGHIERISGKVFLLTPESVNVVAGASEAPAQPDGTFFVTPQQ